MILCDKIESALGARVGIYNLEGRFLHGEDIGYKRTMEVAFNEGNTYVRAGAYIISVKSELSQDACNLIKLISDLYIEKEAADLLQPLEYVLKNDVPYDSLKGRYTNSSVIYLLSKGSIRDILESIYDGCAVEIVEDGEGYYIVKQFDDLEEEGETLKDDICQEKGLNVIIGAGRTIGGSYTVKHSALHAKTASNLARSLGSKQGVYHVDKMILYGLIDSVPQDKIEYYAHAGYQGFDNLVKDRELIETAEELFKCHLNISEASRKLYLHRNTLLYRVEKIKNLTGLDIKKFEEAVIFRTVLSIYKLKWR